MKQQLIISAGSFVDRLFFNLDKSNHLSLHKKFIREMIEGILGARSTLVSNIGRFLNEEISIKQTEKRLCRMLNNDKIEWEELASRSTELGGFLVKPDDVIAFDPGDLIKEHAKKMENLYRVHDGSSGDCGNGYEDFSVEAIHWRDGKKHHIPLYHKLTNAKCEDYVSQNAQICNAIYAVHEHIGNKGIWTFDRQHDRSKIFEKALIPLSKKMRWIVRAKEDRLIIPDNPAHLGSRQYHPGLMDMVNNMNLSEHPTRLNFPKVTGSLHIGFEKVKFDLDKHETPISVVVVHDRRNKSPVVLLTNIPVLSIEGAAVVFGYYLERWGKEEGYRFCKSFLNTESLRTLNWRAIQSLALLAHFTYVFVTLFYRSAPELIDKLCEQKLKHFKHIDDIHYKYYRVAKLMRTLLWEQNNRPIGVLAMTEVG